MQLNVQGPFMQLMLQGRPLRNEHCRQSCVASLQFWNWILACREVKRCHMKHSPQHSHSMSLHTVSEHQPGNQVTLSSALCCLLPLPWLTVHLWSPAEVCSSQKGSATSWLLATGRLGPTNILKGLAAFVLQLFVHNGVQLTAGALTESSACRELVSAGLNSVTLKQVDAELLSRDTRPLSSCQNCQGNLS